MAEANILTFPDQFSCPVCLDLLKDPVALLCGHSFCMRCINGCWDQEDHKGVYSCPQCRQTFTPRPAVSKNTVLAEVLEALKKSGLQARRPAQCSAGPEDVECDFCTGRKSKAIKSCLMCLASFCETHLQLHYESPPFKKHKLVEASRRLQKQICSQHDKLLEVYCRTDQQCICLLCTMDEHKGHNTISAAAGRAEKQNQFLVMLEKSKQRIQVKEKELQKLRKAMETHKQSAQRAVLETKTTLSDLIQTFEKIFSVVMKLIRAHEKATVSQAEEVMNQLMQEIADLKRKDAEMEELSHTEDDIHYLQCFPSVVTSGAADLPAITVSPSHTFEAVLKSVSQFQKTLEADAKVSFEKIQSQVKKVMILPPQSREELLQYSCQLMLDPNTAHHHLHLSDSNRTVTNQGNQPFTVDTSNSNRTVTNPGNQRFPFGASGRSDNRQERYSNRTVTNPGNQDYWSDYEHNYSDVYGQSINCLERSEHPESFTNHSQVLCTESVCEPCYWELEWRGGYGASVAVSYKDINRKGSGNESEFGRNDKSWNLQCNSSSYSFLHNNQQTQIPIKSSSSRIGVFVDHKAGTLSFYSISDKMELVHRVQTTFTQPLYPGFGVNLNSTIKLIEK